MIELIPNLKDLSLSMREADISVRLRQPEQHDLVVRRIGTVAFALHASPDYLERHGEPDYAGGCPGHHLITQLDGIQDATQTEWLADLAPRARIAMHTTSHAAALAATLHVGGLAGLIRFRADREVGLVRVKVPPAVRDPEVRHLPRRAQGQSPDPAHQGGPRPHHALDQGAGRQAEPNRSGRRRS